MCIATFQSVTQSRIPVFVAISAIAQDVYPGFLEFGKVMSMVDNGYGVGSSHSF